MQHIHSGTGVFALLGLAPFLLLVLRLSAFGRNANLAGGFAGRRLWVFCFCVSCFLFPLLVDGCTYTATVLCTFLAFTTSTSVRTEPQATSAAPEKKKTSLTVLSARIHCLACRICLGCSSGAAMSLPPFRGFSPPLPLGCLFVCLVACCFVGFSLFCFVWGGRTLTGAMDWTALQRASLALTSGALCFSVQSAREQQSLQTWFVWCGYAAVILQMVHSVGE